MKIQQTPLLAELVLIGGGHANIQVMRKLAMNPIGGLRVTLVSDKIHAPYSGMLPGFLAGYYNYDQCHFDLPKLCQHYGFRFINDTVTGIDSDKKIILFESRPKLSYDFAAINVGVEPRSLNQDANHILPIKPISTFVSKWKNLINELQDRSTFNKIAVAGGGAAGVEMTLILMQQARNLNLKLEVSLFHRGPWLVSKHNQKAHKKLLTILQNYGVQVHLNKELVDLEPYDKVILSSEAQSPSWFDRSNLPTDSKGFVKVDSNLKVVGTSSLFAAGDCIHFTPQPIKKSGVYAVRQGKILAENIRNAILNKKSLKVFKPQNNVLSLIVTGHKQALAHQDYWSFLSLLPASLLWSLKNKIDLDFIKRFSSLNSEMPTPKNHLNDKIWTANTCGGCGSKIGPSILTTALKELGLESLNEDAAVTNQDSDFVALQSIDQFRSFISDSFVFAEIAVNHALSDIYAMGGKPKNLMVGLSLPPAKDKIQKSDILQAMGGILKAIEYNDAELVGGHTNEAVELSLSIAAYGETTKEKVLYKGNLKVGDHLILTKPLGTGVVLAGLMESKTTGGTLYQALDSMKISNKFALTCLHKFSGTNCTDITGFGLAGHLNEMLSNKFGADIDYFALPALPGAETLFTQSVRASIANKNRESLEQVLDSSITDKSHPLLFDPQTSGGLLFSLNPEQSQQCVLELKEMGYIQASVIGTVTDRKSTINIL